MMPLCVVFACVQGSGPKYKEALEESMNITARYTGMTVLNADLFPSHAASYVLS